MIEYKIRKTNDGDIIECESCNSEVATGEFDWGPPYTEKHETDKRYLCDFCASSFVGNITRYSSKNSSDYERREIAILIAQAVNYLERKIKP